MKVITFQQLQDDFDAIMDDVGDNKSVYKLQTDQGDFMLIPADCYEVMADAYQEWVEHPQSEPEEGFDPYPLPIQYIADAEPKLL